MRLMTWLRSAALTLALLLSAWAGSGPAVATAGTPPSPMGKTLATFPASVGAIAVDHRGTVYLVVSSGVVALPAGGGPMRTIWEGSATDITVDPVGNLFMDSIIRDVSDAPWLRLKLALTLGENLNARLRETWTVTVIVSFDGEDASVRVHRTRSGTSWLADDLEGYAEGILVIEERPRRNGHVNVRGLGRHFRRDPNAYTRGMSVLNTREEVNHGR